ncbi:MAG: cytochrome c [Rhodocyclales bacterium]|nr:cytochrome c [Rhodocyclales bacterium]
MVSGRIALIGVCALTWTAGALAGSGGTNGETVYASRCAACHQPGGNGAPGFAPPLAGTLGTYLHNPEGRSYLANLVVAGMNGRIESQGHQYNGVMPPFSALSDDELAAVLNHVLERFNRASLPDAHTPVSAAEIAAARSRKPSPGQVHRQRLQLLGEAN